ncbi:hypothetical protein [Histidinibacterium aquaticum]|uniref:DUF4407 domain-containing protein n=1 Tax=Histidinibacterium aquaticum TaxID=2613962 RepID=A0A5J5GCB6_9RHOB|nr:hypothetical protein [Histidinibacterium aquaticum]KAA9005598.1 hypothetical protein F3S47_16980 [Histidinibacterium aquaticum]
MSDDSHPSRQEAHGIRHARELEGHLSWLDSFTGAALGVLAVASGIYTYLGVSSLLDDNGALSFFAAMSYSVAVSVGIFVFWSYLMRLLPAVRTMAARVGLFFAMLLGSLAIIAMSSWLNAAALAGAAAVEQHMATTVQTYQRSLEQANAAAVSAQGLERDVARVRQSFEDLSEQEATGQLSGFAGEGAVFRLLQQKSDELSALEEQIESYDPLVAQEFERGNAILSRMRALTVEPGPVEPRSVTFSEEAVQLANVITRLRQLSVAPLVRRAANDLSASVVLPELDGSDAETREGQSATIDSVLTVLGQRAETLRQAAEAVIAMPQPPDTTYTPISTADAVILYAGNFVPSWAGAISIDLLPAVLVLIVAITQSAIRTARGPADTADSMSLAELRSAVRVLREVEGMDRAAPATERPAAETPASDRPAEEPRRPLSAVETNRPAE